MKNQSAFAILLKSLLVVFVMSLTACDEDDHHHGNQVTITIDVPIEHSMYAMGNTVHMEGMAIGQSELHGYELYIFNKTTNDTVFSFNEHQHGDTLHFHEHWDVNVTGDMEFGVVVTLDHEGNRQAQTVEFHCM